MYACVRGGLRTTDHAERPSGDVNEREKRESEEEERAESLADSRENMSSRITHFSEFCIQSIQIWRIQIQRRGVGACVSAARQECWRPPGGGGCTRGAGRW